MRNAFLTRYHLHHPTQRAPATLADWKSDVNPLAADTELRKELLAVGPFCMAPTGELDDEGKSVDQVHYCSPNATRTQRSGVTDVEYMIRPDREFWPVCCNLNHTRAHTRIPHTSTTPPSTLRSEFKFARQRLASESGNDIELCRANLTARIAKCHLNCDACGAHCVNRAVREIVSVAKCTVALPILGMVQAMHSSDLGTDIGYRWGAKRDANRPAQPSNSWEEKYRTLVQNSVDAPMAPRNCNSRALEHHRIAHDYTL